MFKGIKKRFGPNRSGRNRRLGSGGREQGDIPPREPPDKGSSKPTSPRQVYPVKQISPVPYARRSLENRSRTVPMDKTPPSVVNNGAYDRRTDSFCLSPNKEQSVPAYPIAPNICVTGGKIEFITPPGSTLSSNASEIGSSSSTLQYSSPIKSGGSPLRLQNTLASERNHKKMEKSPLKRASKKSSPSKPPLVSSKPRNVSPSSKIPLRNELDANTNLITTNESVKNSGSLELRKNKTKGVRRSTTMPACEDTEIELELLRNENKQVKNKLATLEQEFLKLQNYVQDLKENNSDKCIEKSDKQDKENNISHLKSLSEKCRTLELANAQMQSDSQVQRQQYEKCLDQVASQVVQAILVQKNQQEECEILSKRVEELQLQNTTLSSFIAVKVGHVDPSKLPLHQRAHLLPFSRLTSFSNSQSLPNTLTKPKENSNCDKHIPELKEASSIWYNEPNSSISNRVISHRKTCINPSSSSSLPPSRTSSMKTRSLRHQSSADACWYDIIKSLQSGNTRFVSLNDGHNISSDSSCIDNEESNLVSRNRRVLSGIEDLSSTSSTEDLAPSHSLQNEEEETLSDSTSRVELLSLNGTDSSGTLIASSHCSQSSDVQRISSSEFCLNLESQAAVQQSVVVNFALPSSIPVRCPNTMKIPEEVNSDKLEDATSSENTIKDEGYSTMSSDVQSEVKENVNLCTISTVHEEEKVKSFDQEVEASETNLLEPMNNENSDINNLNRTNLCNQEDEVSKPTKDVNEVRVIYEEEDNNSDIVFVPISESKDNYLRHSFNFPFPDEPYELSRCSSDSYLCKLCVRQPSFHPEERIYKLNALNHNLVLASKNFTLNSKSHKNHYHNYLRRAFRKESFKRACYRYLSKSGFHDLKEEYKKNGSPNYEALCQIFPPSISHPRILSPSYSHAEMEDWSLDLSAEDITTPGTEPSQADSINASHHQSQPSIQEAILDLEEDHHDFLWNGATYLKTTDNELSWPYNKDQGKEAWDLNIMGNKPSHSMISPKSGCSDQPAIWSSSEQLSCCSDIASKCSTDIENFCEQLCNLPELKRVSFCSSDNGGSESASSNLKLSEFDSAEECCSEVLEDLGIDTVFTRDFYRLVKFESTKSLTASSKSLATSEGFLTLEKLKDLESLQDSKTLASVLGFIAEQQKYCKYREQLDESSFARMSRKDKTKSLNSKQSEDKPDSDRRNSSVCESDNILTSSESLSCLDLDVKRIQLFDNRPVVAPPKPKRSTSLNLGRQGGHSYRSRGTLPPLPSNMLPVIPSRSTSRSTLPHLQVSQHSRLCQKEEEAFPPPPPSPPPEDPYTEPYHSIPLEVPAPSVPPHRTPITPRRSSSMIPNPTSIDSPPIPKRITSRALPVPPPERTSSLDHSNVTSINKGNRPRSLLKEATLTNALNKTQQRVSCGDLGPICRNSATLMLELEKMAKAEEDEQKNGECCSPEVTSPSVEVGLGTGWVRVQPSTNLRDPQSRANLLDTMMPSSEGCSSETDEDLAKQLQHKELLKAVQRNRRKKKASHHNEDPSRLVCWQQSRPTILGRQSMFSRYGEEEERALQEFRFLESFPSQTDVASLDRSNKDSIHQYAVPKSQTDLKNLRSSEPFYADSGGYPLSSISPGLCQNPPLVTPYHISPPLSSVDLVDDYCESNPVYQSTEFNEYCPQSPIMDVMSSFSSKSTTPIPSPALRNKFPTFQKHVDASLNRKTYVSPYQSVPSKRVGSSCEVNSSPPPAPLSDKHVGAKSSVGEEPKGFVSHIPVHNKAKDSSNKADFRTNKEYVDTSSLGNVKSVIERLNNRNQNSGTPLKKSSPCLDKNRTRVPPSQCSKSNITSTKSSHMGNRITSSHNNNSSLNSGVNNSLLSKKTPNIPGTNLIKRLTASNQDASVSLPPKCSFVSQTKERQLCSPTTSRSGPLTIIPRSPKLPKFKFGRYRTKKTDSLDAIYGKNLCDSGSSESSEKTGGRISISDSCAEVFSPGESGDEVFKKF